jgi:hypothetical protein
MAITSNRLAGTRQIQAARALTLGKANLVVWGTSRFGIQRGRADCTTEAATIIRHCLGRYQIWDRIRGFLGGRYCRSLTSRTSNQVIKVFGKGTSNSTCQYRHQSTERGAVLQERTTDRCRWSWSSIDLSPLRGILLGRSSQIEDCKTLSVPRASILDVLMFMRLMMRSFENSPFSNFS